ncbi:MAG TPA: M48 family metalloprotease [Candidatus Angelobacter sp.]|jgi:predicted Zn-dependent protease
MEKKCFFRIWIVIAGMVLPSVALTVQDSKTASTSTVGQNQSSPPDQARSEQIPSEKKPGNNPDGKTSSANQNQTPEPFNWYSIENEIKLGKEFAKQVDAKAVFITDPVIGEYVSRIGQNLVRQSDTKFSFSIRVIDSPEPRAFALPGGIVYVNSGLLRTAENESELAAMMAHAIAHVNARHVTRLLSRSEFANAHQKTSAPQKSTLPDFCSLYAMCEDESISVPPAFFKFSRNFEKEADWLGVQYVYKAGYNPNGFLSFLWKREQLEEKTPSPAVRFPSHPPAAERIAMIGKEIRSILSPQPSYVVDTPEFQMIKARLLSLKTQDVHATK